MNLTYTMRAKDVDAVRKAIREAGVPTYWSKEVGYRENFDTGVQTFNLLLAPLSSSENNTDLIEPYPLDDLKRATVQLRDDSSVIKFDIYLHSYPGTDNEELEYNVCIYFDASNGTAWEGKYDDRK